MQQGTPIASLSLDQTQANVASSIAAASSAQAALATAQAEAQQAEAQRAKAAEKQVAASGAGVRQAQAKFINHLVVTPWMSRKTFRLR